MISKDTMTDRAFHAQYSLPAQLQDRASGIILRTRAHGVTIISARQKVRGQWDDLKKNCEAGRGEMRRHGWQILYYCGRGRQLPFGNAQ
eukprot:9483176-Pyramimonas_sp.AAC.1